MRRGSHFIDVGFFSIDRSARMALPYWVSASATQLFVFGSQLADHGGGVAVDFLGMQQHKTAEIQRVAHVRSQRDVSSWITGSRLRTGRLLRQ